MSRQQKRAAERQAQKKGAGPNPAEIAQAFAQAAQLHGMGRLAEAKALCQKILAVAPNHADALHMLGLLAHQAGNARAAEDLLRRAIAVNAKPAEVHNSLGMALAAQGKPDAALACFEAAIKRNPSLAQAHFNRGNALNNLTRLEEARIAYEKAAKARPNHAPTSGYLGNVLGALGLVEEARAAYDQALKLNPADLGPKIRSASLLPVIMESEEKTEALRREMEASLDALLAEDFSIADPLEQIGPPNFYLAYHGRNDRVLQEKTAALCLKACPSLSWTAPHCQAPREKRDRIRLGIASANLSGHTIGKLLGGFIELVDRKRFEVILLRLPGRRDEQADRIDAHADKVVLLSNKLEPARQAIAAEKLDVLFYPDIGMNPLGYYLAFARLAPVQAVSWGHPDTTGIPNMDYFLSAEDLEAEGAEDHYSETLIRLPTLPTYYRRPTQRVEPFDRKAHGLNEAATLYVCPQSLFKVHPDFDPVLAEILAQDPKAQIVFIKGSQASWTKLLSARLAKTMDLARVTFLPRMPTPAFFGLLKAADAVLDTPHFSGGNSSFEAFAMGVPIVTWASAHMRGRVTYACYRKMGLMDCVADKLEDYAGIAVRLATDRAWAEAVRGRLVAKADVLFEDEAAVEGLEDFFGKACSEKAN